MKKKKRNNKQKMLLNIKINKDLNWNDVEAITGYTRQNIDHAFKNGTQKTIDKVLEMLESEGEWQNDVLRRQEQKRKINCFEIK